MRGSLLYHFMCIFSWYTHKPFQSAELLITSAEEQTSLTVTCPTATSSSFLSSYLGGDKYCHFKNGCLSFSAPPPSPDPFLLGTILFLELLVFMIELIELAIDILQVVCVCVCVSEKYHQAGCFVQRLLPGVGLY